MLGTDTSAVCAQDCLVLLKKNIRYHNDAISRAFAYTAEQPGQREWREGESIVLANLALGYPDLRQAERDRRGAHPNLAAWFVCVSACPGLDSTNTGCSLVAVCCRSCLYHW